MKLMRGLHLGDRDRDEMRSGCIGQRRRRVMRAYRIRMSRSKSWMLTNETRCGQNQPRKLEMITDDVCIMNEDIIEGLRRSRLRELYCKINEGRGRRAHENSTTCIMK